ncbi:MAG: hypothetical protein ACYTGV_17895 [Planctomycetota bacterium]|jgi:hypothetical protein
MTDTQTLWLTVTNVTLGVLCLAGFVALFAAVALDIFRGRRDPSRGPCRWLVLRGGNRRQIDSGSTSAG